MLSGKINSYLFLRESTDLTNAAIKAKHAAFQRELSAIRGEHLTFFELELVQLSDDTLKAFYARDAVVSVDGVPVGTAPLAGPIQVSAGRRVVRATLPGRVLDLWTCDGVTAPI